MTELPFVAKKVNRVTVCELRALCQATSPAPERQTFTGWRLIRPVSIFFTRLLILTPITPNQITVISVFVFFSGLSLFIFQIRLVDFLGVFLVYFSSVLDACDGEVARFRRVQFPERPVSHVGALYVEPVSHDVQYGLMFLPLGYAGFLASGSIWPLAFGVVAGTFKLLARLLEHRYWLMTRGMALSPEEIAQLRKTLQERPLYRRLISWVKRNVYSSSGLIIPLLIATVMRHVDWYVIFYGISFLLWWILIFLKQAVSLSQVTSVAGASSEPGSAD